MSWIPFMSVLPSHLHYISKAPFPNNITLGIRFQHMYIGRDTNIQSITDIKDGKWEIWSDFFVNWFFSRYLAKTGLNGPGKSLKLELWGLRGSWLELGQRKPLSSFLLLIPQSGFPANFIFGFTSKIHPTFDHYLPSPVTLLIQATIVVQSLLLLPSLFFFRFFNIEPEWPCLNWSQSASLLWSKPSNGSQLTQCKSQGPHSNPCSPLWLEPHNLLNFTSPLQSHCPFCCPINTQR